VILKHDLIINNLIKSSLYTQSFKSTELNYIVLNFILKHNQIRKFLKWYCLIKNKSLTSRTRAVNKCVISGRSKGVYRFAFISRLFLRENSFINKLPGLIKSYW
jgi:ribosomal protein S14